MTKQKRNMPRVGFSNNNIKRGFSSGRRGTEALTPLRYLPLLGALVWAYSSMASASDECGPLPVPPATQVDCGDSGYPGIMYWPTTDLTLIAGPNVSINPPLDGPGIGIYSIDPAGHANLTVHVAGTTITTEATAAGLSGDGIVIDQAGSGDLSIRADGVTISTSRPGSPPWAVSTGIAASLSGGTSKGNISIDAVHSSITTDGNNSYGLYGLHAGQGNITITSSSQITTSGELAYGISAYGSEPASAGAITVAQSGGTITTTGKGAEGISIAHLGTRRYPGHGSR